MAAFLSVTNGRTDEYGGSFENRLRLPREVVAAVREEVGRGLPRGLPLPRLGGHPGTRTGSIARQHARGRPGHRGGAGAGRARLPLHLARREVRGREAARRWAKPPIPTRATAARPCIPRDKKDPFGVNTYLATGIRKAVRGAGFAIPVVTAREDPHLRAGRVHPARRPRRPRSGWRGPCSPTRTCRASGRSEPTRHARAVRLLPLLRGRGPAPPARHLHPLAESTRRSPTSPHSRGLDLP